MPNAELDLFITFRTALFVGVTIYTVLSWTMTVVQLVALARSRDPRLQFVRRYVGYQLATIRIRPLTSELVQIGLLVLMLIALWWAHRLLVL